MPSILPEEFQLGPRHVRDRKSYAQHLSREKQRAGGRFTAAQMLPPTTLLGERLRQLRAEAGLTQAEMAEQVGYGRTGSGRISDWELGNVLPTLPLLYRCSRIFGTTVSKLLDGVL
jgi:DNA-binding XRE family transcriptional regulator